MRTIYPTIKNVIIATTFLAILPAFMYGQQKRKDAGCIPEKLPSALKLTESRPVKYKVTTDYYNQDIFGIFFNKTEVSGLYTRAAEGGKARWNKVGIAAGTSKEEAFPEATPQDYMEGLQYNPATVTTDTSILKSFPAGNIYGKTLIWDMFTFESFAWRHFDSLQLNIPYHARIYDTTVLLAGSGYFKNRDVKLTWTGISKMNGRTCALIQFEAMDNLLSIETESMKARGRSHYWGNIWVALEDKQLEGAWMNEDVMLEINIPGMNKQLINTTRKLTVEKCKD